MHFLTDRVVEDIVDSLMGYGSGTMAVCPDAWDTSSPLTFVRAALLLRHALPRLPAFFGQPEAV